MLLLKWEQGNSLSVSQSVIWETDGDCRRLLGSNSPCRLQVWRGHTHTPGTEGEYVFGGVEVHPPGELWAHHISHIHKGQGLSSCPHTFMASALTRSD